MSKGLRVAGHPVHPALAHIPIGLLLTSPLWGAVGLWRGEPIWWAIGFWTMVVGVGGGIVAAVAGVVDYIALPHDHPAEGDAMRHIMAVLVALTFFVGALLLQGGAEPPGEGEEFWTLATMITGAATLGLGGWYGGVLVYRHGLGQENAIS